MLMRVGGECHLAECTLRHWGRPEVPKSGNRAASELPHCLSERGDLASNSAHDSVRPTTYGSTSALQLALTGMHVQAGMHALPCAGVRGRLHVDPRILWMTKREVWPQWTYLDVGEADDVFRDGSDAERSDVQRIRRPHNRCRSLCRLLHWFGRHRQQNNAISDHHVALPGCSAFFDPQLRKLSHRVVA